VRSLSVLAAAAAADDDDENKKMVGKKLHRMRMYADDVTDHQHATLRCLSVSLYVSVCMSVCSYVCVGLCMYLSVCRLRVVCLSVYVDYFG